ncbi:hypothetical protein JMJ35_009151 [Cladonia borealis]|uniref:Uncharacterized protein n=1 Tax=Cladonia borealis TaxID=184061 RepID=A0AA39QRW2_9LECA|nr:hypothetical protein JMJ35_009151 [Cladonia borealis]
MSRHFSYSYILYVLLSVLYVNSEPSSDPLEVLTSNSTSIGSSNSTNDIELRCFTPASARFPLNPADCSVAFMQIVLTPGFRVVYRFSKNLRRLDAVKLPKGWTQGDCIIMVSCANDRDTSAFRLSDVAHAARAIINQCVVGRDLSYGGIVGVSDVPSFYVSVAGNAENRPQGNSTTINDTWLGGNNTTLFDTELGGITTLPDTELGGNTTLLDTE